MRSRAFHTVIALALASCLLATLSPAAFALERKKLVRATTGRFSVLPVRIEIATPPGVTQTEELTVINSSGSALEFELRTTDLQAATDPAAFVTQVEKAQFGAGSWVVPETRKFVAADGEQVTLQLRITPPAAPPVGSNYAALDIVGIPVNAPGEKAPNRVSVESSVLMQLFFDVPGDLQRSGRIVSVEASPRLLLSGNTYVSYEVEYENTGNVTDEVGGQIEIKGLFGNEVATLNLQERAVLRGSRRIYRALWTEPPWLGRFTATARLEGDAGKHEQGAPTAYVLPPWWALVLLALAIAGPIAWWIRDRRSWRRYLDEEDDDWSTGAHA